MAETAVANDSISQSVFDLQIKHLRDRADSEEKLSSARFDRLEALMAQNLAEQRAIATELRGELKGMNQRIDTNLTEYKLIASGIQGEMRENNARLEGKIEAMNARFDALQNRFAWNIAWVGIIMGLVLAIAQRIWR